jgi:pentatricopeptide repeat protein
LINERLNESTEFYSLMRKEGVVPVSFIFTALFKACGAKMDVGLRRQIHGQTILVGGFGKDLHVGNSMIDMYINCGFLECGRKVFDEMSNRDVISAHAKSGNMESAEELFDGLFDF